MSDETDREIQRALREWERQDPPPEPPVEAMWGAIQPALPLRDGGVHTDGGLHAAGGSRPSVGAVTSPGPRRARGGARVWVPAVLAAGLAGLVLGRTTAPTETGTSTPSGIEPPAVAVADPALQDEGSGPQDEGSGHQDGGSGAVATGSGGDPAERADEGAVPTPGQIRADAARPGATAPQDRPGEDTSGATADADGADAEMDRDAGTGAPAEGGFAPGTPASLGAPSSAPLRLVATRHLLEVGPMLTRLAGGADPEQGTVPPEIRDWARRLLDETRLILDTPAPLDGELLALLEDLEMILTQVATIPTPSPDVVRLELEIIAEGMSDRRILPRIRTLAGAGNEQ